jgi:hypothetical protein
MSYWLFAENEFNRNVDENNKYFYFANNRKKLIKRNIATGDYIITYVTKIMKLTDIRLVVSNEIKNLPDNIMYDRNFDCYIHTKIFKKLKKENWIDRSIIFPKLNLFQNKIINLVLLSAPIKLDNDDSKKIFEMF